MKPKIGQKQSAEDKKALKSEYLASAMFRKRLEDILDEEIENSIKQMRSAVDKNVMNLPEFYAAQLAKQDALEYVKTLIK